jgi:mannose-6-phosphate isomerase-like protein (cupin superfamily)
MRIFEFQKLKDQRIDLDRSFFEFLRVPSLSMGLYHLPAGTTDPQSPHSEDEVYYLVKGRARIKVGNEDRPVEAGSIVFVEKNVEHRFHTIEEDLEVLVFFAPAEHLLSRKA